MKLKFRGLHALLINQQNEQQKRNFEFLTELKFKQEMFDCLRYASNKQKLLRFALIDTVEKRNRERVGRSLFAWRQAADVKNNIKSSLYQR